MSTIFELIDAGDAQGIRELLTAEPQAAAGHDDAGLTVLMRAAYRGGEIFEAVRAAKPPSERAHSRDGLERTRRYRLRACRERPARHLAATEREAAVDETQAVVELLNRG